MTSVQERLQLKREPIDKWSVREQLCLASAVCRSGDQNWMSVSRALKPFGEPNRPADWFHQKNCAAQYGMLLGNVETPKRKNKKNSLDSGGETPAESILKRLAAERQIELKKLLAEEKAEYQKLQRDMILLQSGKVTEEQLDKWCQEIEEEENCKELESQAHAQFLKERELRKQEIEKVWRPSKTVAGQKRKHSDILDSLIESEHFEDISMQHQQVYPPTPEPTKPALSPLLTSLLKSPTQAQNTPILHTAITNRPMANTTTNPMITSLLNSSTGVTVSPGLQQLVSSAIGQDGSNGMITQHQHPEHLQQQIQPQQPITNDILDDANMPNIKIDDLANSILVQDGPLPEIKKEEVDDIISEIIQADPEQHLQLDGNGDININLELDDFDDEEVLEQINNEQLQQQVQQPQIKEEARIEKKAEEKPVPSLSTPVVDPFEFQEDPVIHLDQSLKVSSINKQEHKQYLPQYQQQISQPEQSASPVKETIENTPQEELITEIKEEDKTFPEPVQEFDSLKEVPVLDETQIKTEEAPVPGSVEIVEVVVTDDEEIDKDLAKTENVGSVKSDDSSAADTRSIKTETEEKIKSEDMAESSPTESKDTDTIATFEESSETLDSVAEVKKEIVETVDGQESGDTKTDFGDDELFDEMKFDKNERKRDYSRLKKKEEKGFDILLAIEKAQMEDTELTEEALSDATTDTEKKDTKQKIKSEVERSNSPWTEEEDSAKGGSKRRYSTPVTPTDSIPNSPASVTALLDDDREYRNWKKSVMLVYNRLATHKYASLFLKPITDDHAPGYSTMVHRPMDLVTIKKNIENGTIRSTLEFKRDTMLMFTNAIMYNRTTSLVYSMAVEMQQECMEPIEILLMAENSKDHSLRRETRTSELGGKRKRTFTDEILVKSAKKKRED